MGINFVAWCGIYTFKSECYFTVVIKHSIIAFKARFIPSRCTTEQHSESFLPVAIKFLYFYIKGVSNIPKTGPWTYFTHISSYKLQNYL